MTERLRRGWRYAGGVLLVAAVLGVGVLVTWPAVSGPSGSPPADGDAPKGEVIGGSEPAAATEAADDDVATCDGAEHGVGYRIRYPADWWASDGERAEPCRWFHPEPFEMPDMPRDVPELAIMVRVQGRSFDEARRLDPERHELRSEEETTVDGHPAVVQEYVLRFRGIYPDGTTLSRFLVDLGEHTLYGVTADADVVQADYDRSRAVLDQIMRGLEVRSGAPARSEEAALCSADALSPEPTPQDDLPIAVAEERAAIVEAAVACDVDRLAELADEPFTYSFGEHGEVAVFLRRQEEAGREPLRYLAELLDRPFATVDVEGATQYVWPAAFAYEDWEDVPDADRDALQPLYDKDDFDDFAMFGGYIGYRVGITEDGRWRFFVAGD